MSSEFNLEPIGTQLQRLLQARDYPKTLCPSEVARALSNDELRRTGASSWRDLMPALRIMAFELRDQGKIQILQKGSILPETQGIEDTTGPIRIRHATSEE